MIKDELQSGGDRHIFYHLIVSASNGTTRTINVGEEPISVGRAPDAKICLDSDSVSRRHCLIVSTPGGLLLIDQESTNGTQVNGEWVSQRRLRHGDIITIGRTMIRIRAKTSCGTAHPMVEKSGTTPPSYGYQLIPEEQIAILRKLCVRLSCVDTVAGAAETLLDVVLQIFPAERALILEPRLQEGGIPGRMVASRRKSDWDQCQLDPMTSPIKNALVTGRPQHHLKSCHSTGGLQFRRIGGAQDRQVICVPLRLGGLGTLVLYLESSHLPEWAASEDMLDLLSALTALASPAISRCKLLDAQIKRAKRANRAEDSFANTAEKDMRDLLDQLCEAVDDSREMAEGPRESSRYHHREGWLEDDRIELEAHIAELEHLQRVRSEMARGLVHDIKNLSQALEANLTLIERLLAAHDLKPTYTEGARSCAQRIDSMAQHMLEVQRMEDGAYVLSTELVDMRDLIDDTIQRYQGQAEQHEVRLEQRISQQACEVIADSNILARVIDNLVENALYHAGSDGWVIVRVRPVSSMIELSVTDSGPGVPTDLRHRIFDEWYRASDTDQHRHGIGLYFCRLAVEAHGGSIRAESEGENSRFDVSLPAAISEPEGVTQLDITPRSQRSRKRSGTNPERRDKGGQKKKKTTDWPSSSSPSP